MKSLNSGWIIEAPYRAVTFVGEETALGGLLQRSLVHLEGGRQLFANLMVVMRKVGLQTGVSSVKRLYDESPGNEEWARELRESGYLALNAHAVIAIWGALETCIEDTIVSILENCPDASQVLARPPVSLPVAGPLDEDESRKLYHKIEGRLRVPGDIVRTYNAILAHFSLSATVSDEMAVVLREVNAVRNCLLHRGGRVDARARVHIVSIPVAEGDSIGVSQDTYLRYHDAVAAWLLALSGSTADSIYFPK